MDFEKSKGPDLLPEADPPLFRALSHVDIGPTVGSLIGTLWGDVTYYARHDDLFSRTDFRILAWSVSLQAAFEREGRWRHHPGFRLASYGFADPVVEGDAFGVLVYVDPDSEPRGAAGQLVVDDDYEFPVFVRPWHFASHGHPSVNPTLGTATCWAASDAASHGILTTYHALSPPGHQGPQVGDFVETTAGSGRLLAKASGVLDAAHVDAPWPQSVRQLPTPALIAQWTDVTFEGRFNQFQSKIVEVTNPRGSLDPRLQNLLFLARGGDEGDSGALIASTDEDPHGLGMYIGAVMSPADERNGVCQHLGQIALAMNLELFEEA